MRTLVSQQGRVGYGYDKGEVPSFDEYVQRLTKYGIPEEYLYNNLYELPEITNGINYDAYDKEQLERIGYPADWVRRCGISPETAKSLPDNVLSEICETLKGIDESMSGCKIDFSAEKEAEKEDIGDRE